MLDHDQKKCVGCGPQAPRTLTAQAPLTPYGVRTKFEAGLNGICAADILGLVKAQESYGTSWRNRGGVGAFMMLARKWDRLENQVKKHNYDIFEAIAHDRRPEGIIDDIRDLRRYLLLVEEHAAAGIVQVAKDASDEGEATGSYVNQG